MKGHLLSPLSRYKKSNYTGENRCIPCTIVNVTISAIATVVLSLIIDPVFGVGFASISLVLIYFWGYLVPGTPTITKRYFPDWVLSKFDKLEEGQTESPDKSGNPEIALRNINVIESCENIEDVCLTDPFNEKWQSSIEKLDTVDDREGHLSEIFNVEPDNLSFVEYENAIVAQSGEERLGQWESRPALLADLASARVLRDQHPNWDNLSAIEQSQILSSLRLFLKSCPSCGGKITRGSDTVESCCRTMDVVAVNCISCNARLLEVGQDW